MSQLDRIAAASGKRLVPADGLGPQAIVAALVGGLILLGGAMMLRSPNGTPAASTRVAAVQAAPAPAPATLAAVDRPALLSLPAAVEATVVAGGPAPADMAVEPRLSAGAEAPTVDERMLAEVEDAARKARARQLAEARRKAAQLAQERAAAEELQRQQLAAQQQREAERAQQVAAEEAAAARQRAAAAAELARQQSVRVAMASPRGVGETCSGVTGLFGEHLCRARECGRVEFASDPVCVRLREREEAQRRASLDR